jgi:hypothetical protein
MSLSQSRQDSDSRNPHQHAQRHSADPKQRVPDDPSTRVGYGRHLATHFCTASVHCGEAFAGDTLRDNPNK